MLYFMRRLWSFTLIEMLVVIAIISILMAMLLPALTRAREEARRTECRSNLSQIGKGIFMYSGQYDEFFPYYNDSDSGTHEKTKSLSLLYPAFISVPRVFRCPSTRDNPKLLNKREVDSNGVPFYSAIGFGPETPNRQWSSFGYDDQVPFGSANAMRPIAADMDGSSVLITGSGTANHSDGQNVLYLDGHVKWTSQNTWDNNGTADNLFTNDLGGGDTDSHIERP